MEKENLDLKTAIQIAKIVVTVPEERMPIIWDIFKQAGLDIGRDGRVEGPYKTSISY